MPGIDRRPAGSGTSGGGGTGTANPGQAAPYTGNGTGSAGTTTGEVRDAWTGSVWKLYQWSGTAWVEVTVPIIITGTQNPYTAHETDVNGGGIGTGGAPDGTVYILQGGSGYGGQFYVYDNVFNTYWISATAAEHDSANDFNVNGFTGTSGGPVAQLNAYAAGAGASSAFMNLAAERYDAGNGTAIAAFTATRAGAGTGDATFNTHAQVVDSASGNATGYNLCEVLNTATGSASFRIRARHHASAEASLNARATSTRAWNEVTGDLEFTTTGIYPIVLSPNGTRYRLKVANDGTLSTEVAP